MDDFFLFHVLRLDLNLLSLVLFILSLVMYASVQDFQLVDDGYYERGLDHQQRIDRRNRCLEAEHRLSIEHRYAEAQIVMSLTQPNAAEATGTIRMKRPSNARLDRRWSLNLDESGRQVLSTGDMTRGQWRMEVDWSLDSVDYFDEARIVIP